MTTPADVREHLREAEAFLRARDPYGATARVKLAARQAATMSSQDGVEVQQEVALALDRFRAAEQAAREEVERRRSLHVTNERLATGMSDEEVALEPPSRPRRSRIAELIGGISRRARRVEPSAFEV